MTDLDSPACTPAPIRTDWPYHLIDAEHEALRASIRSTLRRAVPDPQALDGTKAFPRPLFETLGSQGHYALAFPLSEDGAADPVAAAVLAQELGHLGVYGVADAVFNHIAATWAVLAGGRSTQLANLLNGSTVATLALVEAHLDPDVRATTLTGVTESDRVRLDGAKVYVPNGAAADVFVAPAIVDGELRLAVLDRRDVTPHPLDVMGNWASPMAELDLTGVSCSVDALLPGDAVTAIDVAVRHRRLAEAFALASLAQHAIDEGIAYGLQRMAFDRPVAKYQVWRHRWADRSAEAEMARALALTALRYFVHGEPADAAIASARMFSGRVARAAADDCLQMHGGYGYTMDFAPQRFWRDARQATVVAGGDLVLLEQVANDLGMPSLTHTVPHQNP